MSPQIVSFVDEKKKKDKLIEEEIKRSPWYIQAEQKYKKNKFIVNGL